MEPKPSYFLDTNLNIIKVNRITGLKVLDQPDLKTKEYTWKEVITFDDNVRENHKNKLTKAISSTALIKESIFKLSGPTPLIGEIKPLRT